MAVAFLAFSLAGGWIWPAPAPSLAQISPPANTVLDLAQRRRALAERMEEATVWILVFGRDGLTTGSGFVVGDGLILTNGHVIGTRAPSEIVILNDSLPATEARLMAIDYDPSEDEAVGGRDFALLAYDSGSSRRLPSLTFNLEARKMDLVGAWGFPSAVMQFDRNYRDLLSGRGDSLKAPSVVFTEGSISALVEGDLGTVIMHSASVSSGNSGGPLVNMAGEVVGVNTQRYANREDLAVLNIALGANDIVSFLVECGVAPRLSEGQTLASLQPRRARRAPSGPSGGEPEWRKPRDDGQTKSLTSFSLTVPSGWGVIFEEEDSIVLGTHDFTTSMWLLVAGNSGLTLAEVAQFYSVLLEGDEPVEDEEGVYVFSGTDEEGDPTIVVVSGIDDDRHLMVSLSGNVEEPGVQIILDSLDDS